MPDTPFQAGCKNIIAGTCGGVAIVAVGHPFDTVKVRLQCQKALMCPTHAPLYVGPLDCARKTLAQEGPLGLYRGAASPLLGQMFFRATLFLSNGECKRYVGGGIPPAEMSLKQITVAGIMTGLIVSFVESPIDMFKSKMQVLRFQEEMARARGETFSGFKSTWQCVSHIASNYGVRGVYQGLQATIIRNVWTNGFFWSSMEFVKRALTPKVDVVKSSLMSDAVEPSKRQYKNWLDCAKKVYVHGGVRRFYSGLTPCLLRAAPANTAMFYAFETVSDWLGADL